MEKGCAQRQHDEKSAGRPVELGHEARVASAKLRLIDRGLGKKLFEAPRRKRHRVWEEEGVLVHHNQKNSARSDSLSATRHTSGCFVEVQKRFKLFDKLGRGGEGGGG